MTFSVDFLGSWRMNPSVFGDPLTLTLSPLSGQNIHLQTSMSDGQIANQWIKVSISLLLCTFSQNANFAQNISPNLISILFSMNCYETAGFSPNLHFKDHIDFQLCCVLKRVFEQNKTKSLQPLLRKTNCYRKIT